MTVQPAERDAVALAVEDCLPGERVSEIQARGTWMRHIYAVRTESGLEACLKVDPDTASGMSAKEDYVARLLRDHRLPSPASLCLEDDGALLGAPFILQQRVGGRRLIDLVASADPLTRRAIYRALGRYYRRLHAITAPRSGWIAGTGEVLPVSPNSFQQEKVIVEVGGQLVADGLIDRRAHRRLARLMADSLPYLADHQPTLVRGPLPWTIYLDSATDYQVTKETDLHDYLWWDPAWDLTAIRHPAFMDVDESCWLAFLEEYGEEPPERRLELYRLMQLVDASAGNYREPALANRDPWRAAAIERLSALVAEAQWA